MTNEPEIIDVVIVDDHHLFRQGAMMALSPYNDINVLWTASNGRELLEGLKTRKIPEIVIMGISMPEMNGLVTLDHLRKLDLKVKVIILSMHNSQEVTLDAMSRGARTYLTKNVSQEEIHSAVISVHTYGSYLSEHLRGILLKMQDKAGPSAQE